MNSFRHVLHLVVLLALCACGRLDRVDEPTVLARPLLQRAPSKQQLAVARAELNALAVPEDVEVASFELLRTTLDALLAKQAGMKSSSLLPAAERNVIEDIAINGDGAGGYNLSWSYKNVGDYGLNGEVGISDLTPLGSNLNKSTESADWASARAADGDNNGVISVSDLTPIGANLLAQVSGYNIYAGDSGTGPWTKVTEVGLDSMSDGFPPKFSVALSAPIAVYYTIAPFDSTGADAINSLGAAVPPTAATVQLGATTELVSQTVGNAGGTLNGPVGTPLEGVIVNVPAGALGGDFNIALGYNDGTVTPAAGEVGSPIITLITDFDGDLRFEEPVRITMPYDGEGSEFGVPYYINEQGGFEACNVVDATFGINPTITFETWHASPYLVIKALTEDPFSDQFDSRFNPVKHGFQIGSKFADYDFAGGMGAFTEWFYRTRHEPLYDRFTGPVSVGYIGQHLIAMRANAAAYVNLSRQESDFFRNNISGATKWNMLRNAIRNSGGPVPLLLVANNRYVYCLAFSFVGNDVFCYDMQNPGVTFEATYSEATEDFVGYGAEKFTFFGSGSMAYREPFENILRDAEAGFHNSPDAVFDLGGVADGDIILHPNLHIEGQVHSGSHLIRRVEVTGDTLPQRVVVDVPLGGALTLDLPLLNGDNHFLFRALAYTPKGGWLEVNSNLSNKLLRIKGDFVQTGPVFKFEIEALPAQDEFSTEGTFELFAKVLHNGEFVYFRSSSPSTLPSGTGMIDANTFVVLSPDTPVLSPYFRVRRTDPQPEPKQAYFRYRIHNPNHPDPQWHVLENQQVLTATALDDDPHWEDPGFYHGWSSIWGPLTWWHEW